MTKEEAKMFISNKSYLIGTVTKHEGEFWTLTSFKALKIPKSNDYKVIVKMNQGIEKTNYFELLFAEDYSLFFSE